MEITKLKTQKVQLDDIQKIWGSPLTPFAIERFNKYELEFRELDDYEKEECILQIVQKLLDRNLVAAGEHRRDDWQKGWGENLSDFRNEKTENKIIPKYFGKFPFLRWNRRFIYGQSKQFEYSMLSILQYVIFDQYLRDCEYIYEFGCGTGHNLLRMREVNPTAQICGLDWASSSQELIDNIARERRDSKLKSKNFDYFNPDVNFILPRNSAVVTVASLEQIGTKHGPFLDYLLNQKPKLCIHIEPIPELLDASNLNDYLSIEYMKKRNYLTD